MPKNTRKRKTTFSNNDAWKIDFHIQKNEIRFLHLTMLKGWLKMYNLTVRPQTLETVPGNVGLTFQDTGKTRTSWIGFIPVA